jgi:aspartyl-tRNA(Asn)/glutamyl-tRNA(Gln) amidotransferase subunit B
LVSSKKLADFYEDTVKLYNNPKTVSNWVMGEVLRLLNLDNIGVEQSKLTSQSLAELLELIDKGVVSISIGKTVLEDIYKTGKAPGVIIDEKNLRQVGDRDELARIVAEVLQENPGPVADVLSGKGKAIGFLVGQIMRKTKGRANPGLANELLREKLDEMKN